MKLLKSKTLLFSSCLLLSACSVLDDLYLIKATIPNEFAGHWTDKKNASVAYCYPRSDYSEYPIWVIRPNENVIFLSGFGGYDILGFYSYSPTAFVAKAKITVDDNTPETYGRISVKLLNKKTIQIDGSNYYRCPKSPY